MEQGLIKSFLPKIAFDTFKKAKIDYEETGSFSSEVLEILHSYFDDSFVQATELLEKCRITCYALPGKLRKIYEVYTAQEQYTIYENINFCHCTFFKNRVLDTRSSLSCKHVLVVLLAEIMSKIREEQFSDNIFEEYLNLQFNIFLEKDTQEIL